MIQIKQRSEDQCNGGIKRREGAVSLVSPRSGPTVVSSSTLIGFDNLNISYLPEEGGSNILERCTKSFPSALFCHSFIKEVVAVLVDVL